MGDRSAPLELRGVVKSFGRVRALDGLDLRVGPGEVHGFLGPNGSGKSTAIRIALGLLRPDAGTVTVFGLDAWRDAKSAHTRLAYVPGDVALWPGLTGGEVLDLLGRVRGGVDVARRRTLVDRFRLDESRKCRDYSKGNRQKVALIAALSTDADLLLLDEPTTGLDPLMEAEFHACVREFRAAGGAVLLSSHVLAEVEQLCDRVTIIREGRTVESGTLSELRQLTRTTVVAEFTRAPHSVMTRPDVHLTRSEASRVEFDVETSRLGTVLEALIPFGITSLICHPPTLEELFLRHYSAEGEDRS